MSRKEGYYWVKFCLGYNHETLEDIIVWTIANWAIGDYDGAKFEWLRNGWEVAMQDNDFIEINENRILAPDEQ